MTLVRTIETKIHRTLAVGQYYQPAKIEVGYQGLGLVNLVLLELFEVLVSRHQISFDNKFGLSLSYSRILNKKG